MSHLLLLYSLFSFIVAGGLFFRRSGKSALLGAFVLMLGIEIIDFLYSNSQLKFIYPQYYALYYFLAGFIYGPLLLMHFRGYIEKSFRPTIYQLYHLLPFALASVYLWDILTMPGLARIAFIQDNFISIIMPMNYARASHLLIYGFVLIGYLLWQNKLLTPRDKLYTWSVALIYFLSCVLISWFTEFANSWRDFDLYYFVAITIVFVVGVLLYKDPKFLQEIAEKYLKSSLTEADKKRVVEKIQAAFNDKEVFRQQDLSLSKLGEIIAEKNHNISQTFTEAFNEPFVEYLNRHRVIYAMNLLKAPECQKYTLEAIGQEAGFNNRVSFSNAFRKVTDCTPSEYRKKVSPIKKSL